MQVCDYAVYFDSIPKSTIFYVRQIHYALTEVMHVTHNAFIGVIPYDTAAPKASGARCVVAKRAIVGKGPREERVCVFAFLNVPFRDLFLPDFVLGLNNRSNFIPYQPLCTPATQWPPAHAAGRTFSGRRPSHRNECLRANAHRIVAPPCIWNFWI